MKKENLNGSILFKIRGCGLCVLLDKNCDGNQVFYDQKYLANGSVGGITSINSYDDNLKYKHYYSSECESGEYDIVGIKQCRSTPQAIHMVLNGIEPKEWDWVKQEKSEKEIQLEELIGKLSIQLKDAELELGRIKANQM